MNYIQKATSGLILAVAPLVGGCQTAPSIDNKVSEYQTAKQAEQKDYASKGVYEKIEHATDALKNLNADGVINPAKTPAQVDEIVDLFTNEDRLKELQNSELVKKDANLSKLVADGLALAESYKTALASSDQFKQYAIIKYQDNNAGASVAWFGVYFGNNAQINGNVADNSAKLGTNRDSSLKNNNSYSGTFGWDPETPVVGDKVDQIRALTERVTEDKYAAFAELIPAEGLQVKAMKTASGKDRAKETITREEFTKWVKENKIKGVYIATVGSQKEPAKKDDKSGADNSELKKEYDAKIDALAKELEALKGKGSDTSKMEELLKKAEAERKAAEESAKKAEADRKAAEEAAKKAEADRKAAEEAAKKSGVKVPGPGSYDDPKK